MGLEALWCGCLQCAPEPVSLGNSRARRASWCSKPQAPFQSFAKMAGAAAFFAVPGFGGRSPKLLWKASRLGFCYWLDQLAMQLVRWLTLAAALVVAYQLRIPLKAAAMINNADRCHGQGLRGAVPIDRSERTVPDFGLKSPVTKNPAPRKLMPPAHSALATWCCLACCFRDLQVGADRCIVMVSGVAVGGRRNPLSLSACSNSLTPTASVAQLGCNWLCSGT